jgi:hypothetical protein
VIGESKNTGEGAWRHKILEIQAKWVRFGSLFELIWGVFGIDFGLIATETG